MSKLVAILTYDSFDDFGLRGKSFELRGYEGRFETHTDTGAQVEFQRGYTKQPRLRGVIGERIIRPTLAEIFRILNYKLVEPRASSLAEAIAMNLEHPGLKPLYIAFEVQDQVLVPADWYSLAGVEAHA